MHDAPAGPRTVGGISARIIPLPVHPAWKVESVRRRRPLVWLVSTLIAVLVGGLVGLLFGIIGDRDALSVLAAPGLLGPFSFLAIVIVAALFLKWRAKRLKGSVQEDRIDLVPTSSARFLLRSDSVHLEAADVSDVVVMDRPSGRELVLVSHETFIRLPLGRVFGFRLESFLRSVPGPGSERALEVLASLSDAERAAATVGDGSAESMRRAVGICSTMGCWSLADKGLSALLDMLPIRDVIEDLWRVERMHLAYMGLYRFLDRLMAHEAVFAHDEDLRGRIFADWIRINLAFGFHRVADAFLRRLLDDDLAVGELPLDRWKFARQSGPTVRARTFGFLSQGRCRIEEGAVAFVDGRKLDLGILAAVMPHLGFVGVRSVSLYDVWGQRHDVQSGQVTGALEDWVVALRLAAPHLLELHDQWAWSVGSRRLVRRFGRLLAA
ncbi:MAG: hypothetical protein J7M25_10485 [Deltaproteobacteria bacterium]|nr:hypothetical protein [Deltaproteobacteria bacterium]